MARLEGEVPADTLEAYRRAGGGDYALLDQLEEDRLARKIEGTDPWSFPPGTQAELLCAWNAFMMQALGDAFLDADYAANPSTVGLFAAMVFDRAWSVLLLPCSRYVLASAPSLAPPGGPTELVKPVRFLLGQCQSTNHIRVIAHLLHNPYLDLWHAQRQTIEQRQALIIRALVNRDHALLRKIKASRARYTHLYSYAIPTEEALLAIHEYRPIIEIGAGTGYWSYLLRQLGTDVVCYDSHPPTPDSNDNRFHVRSGCWTDVLEGTETALDRHPDRTLFLCWPPPRDAMAFRTLRRYCGEYFIYVGEESLADGVRGSTADDQLLELITDEWTLVKRVSLPNWELCWDALHLFRRRSMAEAECDSAVTRRSEGDQMSYQAVGSRK